MPSFCMRMKRLCRDRLCRMEFWKIEDTELVKISKTDVFVGLQHIHVVTMVFMDNFFVHNLWH